MSLYLNHFGLREAPYRITPHTEFFFDGANRGSTLDALVYAIVHDEGIVKVTGEVGSGKTMLCRMLLERLPSSVETLYFANPSLNREELLLALADELKLPDAPHHAHQLLRAIQQHLVKLHESGKQVVVLIDEAHAMPQESLEEIRLLSNLETQRAKLLQIVLFGQPELNEILGTQDMRQLRERVTHNFYLDPLKQTDVATYLMFRLRAAGYHGPDLFSPAAIQRFAAVSHGLTRRLNILADKALLAAFAGNTHLIDLKLANIAVTDAQFDDTGVSIPSNQGPKFWRPMAWIAGAVILVTGGWLIGQNQSNFRNPEIRSPSVPAQTPPLSPTPTPATAAPTVSPPATGVAQPVPSAPLPVPGPEKSGVPAKTLQAPPPVAKAASHERSRPLLAEHLTRFSTWVPAANRHHFVIQLLRLPAHHADKAEAFLRQIVPLAEPTPLLAYELPAGDLRWIGILYGEYATATEAEQKLATLPRALRAYQPFIRPIRQLKE